jgi:hypothetical protein
MRYGLYDGYLQGGLQRIAESNCSDCNKPLAFYIIMEERKAWMLGLPIEMVTKKVT